MNATGRITVLGLVLVVVGCTQPSRPAPSSSSSASATVASAAPKRITVALLSDLPTFSSRLNSPLPGSSEIEDFVNAGLGTVDGDDVLHLQLGEAIPTLENGLWKLMPDGQMEVTWKIRNGARWHDGAPFTADDLVFTMQVVRDRELPLWGDAIYLDIDSIEATDPRTLVVHWKRPTLWADALFSRTLAMPLPKHLLEKAFTEEKGTFAQLPYWNTAYVGVGPYKVREWVSGSHTVLDAFDGYVLGRAKIDQIELKFTTDSNTLIANILSGALDTTVGRGISMEQAIQARDQWRDGKTEFGLSSWIAVYPQFIDPNPAVVTNLQLRQAMLHAVDREEMVQTIQGGLVPVAHTFLRPGQAQYRDLEARATRYDYDPRRASQLVESIGYTRGGDGALRDAAGQKLEFEVRTFDTDINRKSAFSTQDYWQRIGLGVEVVVVPTSRQRDREYQATYPGFTQQRYLYDRNLVRAMHSSRVPVPENGYSGANNIRYINAELDALSERYFATIPPAERIPIMEQVVRHVTQNLNVMGLFYDAQPAMIRNRLKNVPSQGLAWNVNAWEVAD